MASFGETLKREREMREISLREISDATKINIRYLEVLEQNHFDILPGGLFNKGFIRAYAVYVGIDGEAMVTSYLHEIASRDQKSVAAQGEPPPELHRPAETPRRRATPAAEAAPPAARPAPRAPQGGSSPGTPATPPRFVEMTVAPTAARTTSPGPAARPGSAAPPGISLEEPAPPAAEQHRPSRVLGGLVALVAGLAAIFLLLALVMPMLRPRPVEGDRRAAAAPSSDLFAVPTTAPGPENAARDTGEEPATSGEPAPVTAPPAPGERRPADEGQNVAAFGSTPAARRPATAETPRSTPPTLPSPSPPPSAEGAKPSRAAAAEPAGPMQLQVEATGRTWVQLTCDSRDAINWVMRAGDSEAMECLRLIRVSAADAAAVRLSVNGAPCMPLGEAGDRVYGYTIRNDDFRLICPPAGRGEHARD